MATRKKQTEETFEQAADERGRILLDRPHTTTEARELDEQNRERFLEGRRKRFDGRRGPR